jgi:hypothetical protein
MQSTTVEKKRRWFRPALGRCCPSFDQWGGAGTSEIRGDDGEILEFWAVVGRRKANAALPFGS